MSEAHADRDRQAKTSPHARQCQAVVALAEAGRPDWKSADDIA